MRITRKMVVDSIIRQNQNFPNCNLIRRGEDLHIECMNGQFKKFNFRASFRVSDNAMTYYDTWKFLTENPQIEITQLIEENEKKLSENQLRKVYVRGKNE